MSVDTPLILVDGSSYLYRAFHALPPLTNSQGQPTGAVYGVLNMLRRLITDYQPNYMAVIFDAKGKTFRDDLYAEYKAHRPIMPTELQSQIEPLHAIIQALGIPLLMVPGVEADDVIGTLALQAKAQGMHTLISTGDKDMAQLVCPEITLINTMTNTALDVAGVKTKFGIKVEQVIDYFALVGDAVDNVPGVPKVGPKTAVKWLDAYGNLDAIMASAHEITGKIGENLREALVSLPLSRELVTIKCDVPLTLGPQDLTLNKQDRATLIDWYKRLEFKSWLAELLQAQSPEQRPATHYQTIVDKENFERWLARLTKAEFFAFDTETTSLDYMAAEIVGVSFAIQPNEAAYVPFGHDYLDAPTQLSKDYVLSQLKPLLENPDLKKLGHNLKYDLEVLANHGIHLRGITYDSMLESYILNSTANRHDMDSLALKYLGYKTTTFEEIAGKGAKQLTFNQIPLETAGHYAAEDADITLQLHQKLWPSVASEPGLRGVFEVIEMPMITVLSQLERTGVLINAELLTQQSQELAKRLLELEEETYALAGRMFNLGSPKQLQEILYGNLGLPILEKTPTGQPSTAENVLQELALSYPLPKLILEYRSLSKLKSTYTDKLPKQINPKTGRVHTSYNQAVVATGRLSSTDPNLQNIPVRTEEGRRIRQAFVAPAGYKIVAADYSQIELRIMAHLSQDQGLLTAFAQNLDIHSATAAEIFNIPLEQVSALQRRSAKAINFGLIYGMSAFGLAKQLGIGRNEAQFYIDRYFARYPGVKQYMEDTRAKAKEIGYVETLFGRRLYVPDINARNLQRQRAAERIAINAPMQGTAADIIKLAMIRTATRIIKPAIDGRMIMQVHDELVFEIAESDLDKAIVMIKQCMMEAAQLRVPLIVDVGIGDNWDEAH
ncbi:MAG: polymerase [Gammaproteobacteria bacterium]|nr:polymerase [Gammaproteobacteria bacterium]